MTQPVCRRVVAAVTALGLLAAMTVASSSALAAPGLVEPHLPASNGHLGDLPPLEVTTDGTATQPLAAPRIKNFDLPKGHTLVIHAGGGNYGGSQALTGGGGPCLACGSIE